MPRPAQPPFLTSRDLDEVMPYIAGECVPSASSDYLPVYNPASGQSLARLPLGSAEDVNKAVSAARHSFQRGSWRNLPPSGRKATLLRWADLIQSNAARLDALDALEMGKPLSLRAFSAAAAANLVRFNAEAVDKCFGDVLATDRTSTVLQKRVPRGVVAAVVPWNFPTYNVVLKVAPALAAGNSVVLKPSELASQSAMLLTKLATEAGLPPAVLNMVPGAGEIVGRALGEHCDVNMLTFTGSSNVGKLMLQYAGRSNMKVVSAECGGKSPQIVFDDGVDLDVAAQNIAAMITLNQGQVCSTGSRLLAQESIAEKLIGKIVAQLERIVAGDPQHPSTTYGPLVSRAQLEKVESYIRAASLHGASLAYGGSRILPESDGYYLQPTVFSDVVPENPIAREEIFGPVLAVLKFRNIDEAVQLANATFYGLAAYVWTAQISTGFKLAESLSTAVTMINAMARSGEGPGAGFSGEPHGMSGVGVEGGLAGLESYMRRQTVWFNHG